MFWQQAGEEERQIIYLKSDLFQNPLVNHLARRSPESSPAVFRLLLGLLVRFESSVIQPEQKPYSVPLVHCTGRVGGSHLPPTSPVVLVAVSCGDLSMLRFMSVLCLWECLR